MRARGVVHMSAERERTDDERRRRAPCQSERRVVKSECGREGKGALQAVSTGGNARQRETSRVADGDQDRQTENSD